MLKNKLRNNIIFVFNLNLFPIFNTKILIFLKGNRFLIFHFTTIILTLNISINHPTQDGNKLLQFRIALFCQSLIDGIAFY